jgi:hypothetical protein
MILRKVVSENGKIVYEPIPFQEAIKISKTELVFTDEDEEEEYDDFIDESDEELKSNKKDINNRLFHGKPIIVMPQIKIQKIISGLPFLDDEDLKEMVDEITSNSSAYKDLPIAALMPFLDDEDADRLFLKCVDDDHLSKKFDISSMVHFVSEACLDKLAEGYMLGKYQHINLDAVYPFMSSKTIKKLFKYHLNKK